MVVPSRHQSACGVQSVVEQKHPEDGSVYLCLSPCDGCKNPVGVMVWLTEKYPSLLEDFQTGTASMARKRHLASTARGFYCFCLTSTTGQLLHLALGCLEGSTMSNLVHRRRRCARIVPYMILLPGGQYARGWILFLPRIERIERSCPMEERRDQKVCCFPWAYALTA